MDYLRQEGNLQIEKIINKHEYFQKWSSISQQQYQVKYKGESYLNTRWIPKQELDKDLVDQYEQQFDRLRISKQCKEQDDSQNGSQDNDDYQSKQQEGTRKQHNQKRRLKETSFQQQSRPKLIREVKNLQGENGFRLCINTVIKKQQNHYIYGDRVQEILSQIHNVYQKVNKNQQKSIIQGMNSTEQLKKFSRQFYQERLVKKIEMNLGDYQQKALLSKINSQHKSKMNSQQKSKMSSQHKSKMNNQQKVRNKQQYISKGLYIQMSELKQMQALKDRGVFIKIFMRVKWTDGTVSKVKMDYLNQYQPQMMLKYRDSRKSYWRDWKLRQKTYIIQNNLYDQNYEIAEQIDQIKYLQTPKTQKGESESSYETSSSSMIEITQIQRNNKQIQALILQKVNNVRKQNQYQSRSQQIRVKNIKRQFSFAKRQQIQGSNLIRKHVKQTEQRKGQNNQLHYKQMKCNQRQMIKQMINNETKYMCQQNGSDQIKDNNNNQSNKVNNIVSYVPKYQQLEITVNDHKQQNSTKQQKSIYNSSQFKQKYQQQQQQKQQFKQKQTRNSLSQQQHQKSITEYFKKSKLQQILDKTQYISRKSINQQALQLSKSKKLLQNYGIYSLKLQKSYGLTSQKVQKQILSKTNFINDQKIIKKSIIPYNEQNSETHSFKYNREREILNSNNKNSEDNILKNVNDVDNNRKQVNENSNNLIERRQSCIQRDQISSKLKRERIEISLDENISRKIIERSMNRLNEIRNQQEIPKYIQVIEIQDD